MQPFITDHARQRYAERFADGPPLETMLAQAHPWGGQFSGDAYLLAPNDAVFVLSTNDLGLGVKTVLTKAMATANMHARGLGRTGGAMRRAEREAIKRSKPRKTQPLPRLAASPADSPPPIPIPAPGKSHDTRVADGQTIKQFAAALPTVTDEVLDAMHAEYDAKRVDPKENKRVVGGILLAICTERARRKKMKKKVNSVTAEQFNIAFRRLVRNALGDDAYKTLCRTAEAEAKRAVHG